MKGFEGLAERYREEGWLVDKADVVRGKVLGDGASGVTYGGECRGRQVAIKEYSPNVLEVDAASVKNEMDILASVKHENIVEFVGLCLGDDPPSASLLTALAPKGELGHALHTSRILRRKGDAVKFRIALGLAKGLQHLHSLNIIHRDIKPANILLDDDFNPLLTDFGFSRFMDTSGNMTGETGTYRTMAPEVIRHGKYSASADTYSCAMVINELFAEERPYEFLIPIDAAVGVVKRGLRPSQKRVKSPRVRKIIQRMWEQDPDKRPGWPEIIAEFEAARDEGGGSSSRDAFRGLLPQKSPGSPGATMAGSGKASEKSKPNLGTLFKRLGASGHGRGKSADGKSADGKSADAKPEDKKPAKKGANNHSLPMEDEPTV